MSDEYDDRRERPEPDAEDRSDEHEQDRVARLLADTGGAEPMPADVAARLDAVLADLARRGDVPDHAADSPPVPAPPPVTGAPPAREAAPSPAPADRPDAGDELAARRRRRRWPQLLVAAATVGVLGLGAGTVLDSLDGGGLDSAEDASAGAAAEDPGAAGGDESAAQEGPATALRQEDAPAEAGELDGDRAGTEDTDAQALATVGVPRLRSDSLAVDVQRAVDLSRPADDGLDLARACVQPDLAPGDAWLRARLDGAPAVLVLRDPAEGRRTAEVFTCDDGDTPAARVRIDAR